MRVVGHALERPRRVGEGEAVGDARIEAVRRDGADHRIEALARATGDALQPHLPHYRERQRDRGFGAGEDPDQRDRSARADETQRGVQRVGAADLDDEVDRAARQFARASSSRLRGDS
jgi:hypothetical protein